MLFDAPWEEKRIKINHNEALVLDQVLTLSSYSSDFLEWLMNKDLVNLRHQACAIFSDDNVPEDYLIIDSETILKLLLCIIPTTIMIGPDAAGYTLKCKLTKAAQEVSKDEQDKDNTIDIERLMNR